MSSTPEFSATRKFSERAIRIWLRTRGDVAGRQAVGVALDQAQTRPRVDLLVQPAADIDLLAVGAAEAFDLLLRQVHQGLRRTFGLPDIVRHPVAQMQGQIADRRDPTACRGLLDDPIQLGEPLPDTGTDGDPIGVEGVIGLELLAQGIPRLDDVLLPVKGVDHLAQADRDDDARDDRQQFARELFQALGLRPMALQGASPRRRGYFARSFNRLSQCARSPSIASTGARSFRPWAKSSDDFMKRPETP